jgi:hypothetical protein
MRLVNAGEILQITEYTSKFDDTTKVAATKHELIIRSVWKIDGQELASAEKVQEYNKTHNTELTTLEYLRIWSRNLEQIVINMLDSTIGELQLKQVRLLQGISQCGVCGRAFAEVPDGSQELLYSVNEIICSDCYEELKLQPDRLKDWDYQAMVQSPVVEDTTVKSKDQQEDKSSTPPKNTDNKVDPSQDLEYYYCSCGEKFTDLKYYISHRDSCTVSRQS